MGTTQNQPNTPSIPQTFLVANRISDVSYTSNTTLLAAIIPPNQTINSPYVGPQFRIPGAPGAVSLYTQDTNTTSNEFGALTVASNYTVGTVGNGSTEVRTLGAGIGTNWVAARPNTVPSPNTISYHVYSVQGLQPYPQQIALPAPSVAAGQLAPSPTPVFAPAFFGDDSIGISTLTTPIVQAQGPINAIFQSGPPTMPNTIPTITVYPFESRFFGGFMHPNNNFLYVTRDGGILVFRCERNGALTNIGAVSTGTGTARAKVGVFSQNGNFFYVSNDSGQISAFSVNSATGQLTALAGSPFQSGDGTLGLTIDRTGKFLYAVNQRAQSLSGFSIDSTTGALTSLPNFPIGLNPGSFPAFICSHPTKDALYMTNQGGNSLAARTTTGQGNYTFPAPFSNLLTVWTLSPDTGQITLLENEQGVLGVRNMNVPIVDSTGRNVYVTCGRDPFPYNAFDNEARGTYGGGVEGFRLSTDGSASFVTTTTEGGNDSPLDPVGIVPLQINNIAP